MECSHLPSCWVLLNKCRAWRAQDLKGDDKRSLQRMVSSDCKMDLSLTGEIPCNAVQSVNHLFHKVELLELRTYAQTTYYYTLTLIEIPKGLL